MFFDEKTDRKSMLTNISEMEGRLHKKLDDYDTDQYAEKFHDDWKEKIIKV